MKGKLIKKEDTWYVMYVKENEFDNYYELHPKDVEQLLFEIIMGRGFILIDQHMTGVLIALKNQNIWSKTVIELNELLWWVEPDHRNGTIGGRLWKEFDRMAEEMLKAGTIQMVVTSVSPIGPMIDYTKRGYSILGASFFRE